jgi:hypothetical protein
VRFFWVRTVCSSEGDKHFGVTSRLHLQGQSCSSTLKIERICYSETSGATRRHKLEDRTFHSFRQEILKSNSIPHRKHLVSITKINRFVIFREIIAIYCENCTKHVNTHYVGKMQSFFYIKAGGTYNYPSQWPRGLKHELSSLTRKLGSWVRIPLKTWMSVLCAFILCLCRPVCR